MIEEKRTLRLPRLDERLRCIAEQVPVCDLAADIGADHGKLACYLLAKGICRRMIVSDISEDSLNKSRRLLTLHGLSTRADLVVADGLDAVSSPVSAVIIAGMGGKTIADIIRKHEKIGDARLIISAHTDMHTLREKLYEYGFFFEKEIVLRAGGRYYTVMTARKGAADYTPKDLYIGVNLRGECTIDYLMWRQKVVGAWRGRENDLYLQWLGEAIENETGRQSADL